MTPRGVCHLASGDLWAGAEVQTAEMLRGLARSERYRPSAILLNEGRLAEEVRASSIPVTVLDESHLSFFELVRRVADLQRRQGFDIVHTHRYKENTIAVGALAWLLATLHLTRTTCWAPLVPLLVPASVACAALAWHLVQARFSPLHPWALRWLPAVCRHRAVHGVCLVDGFGVA